MIQKQIWIIDLENLWLDFLKPILCLSCSATNSAFYFYFVNINAPTWGT